jgi:hypothetical protein
LGVSVSAHGRAGQGHYKIFSLLERSERKNRARKKITEARRVGAPRWSSEPREAGRADTLTIFFEIRSNFSKNEHHSGNGEVVHWGQNQLFN